MTTPGELVAARVAESAAALIALSHDLHEHPETAFQEHHAAASVAALLDDAGFDVRRGVCDLETAFVATSGSGPVRIGLCAEYDALPDVGHACGHNVIAASTLGAALGLASVADDVGATVVVLGTPAEEGGGGKVLMLEGGAFAGLDVAMMVHPWPEDRLEARCLAVDHFDVHFTGKEAHASAAPWAGVNAADAMTIAQVAIGLLRQQVVPGDQVHGVVTHGGAAANIIPAHVAGRFMCRSLDAEGLVVLRGRVNACFEAGARATGATLSVEEVGRPYSHMRSDPALLAAYRRHAESLGREFAADDADEPLPTLSTDMANVSLEIPTIHPLIGLESNGAVNHQPAFAAACATPSADRAVVDGAIALALTGIDVATDDALRARLGAAIRPGQPPGR
ncbi:MAG TPA: M20 family metallopeptidase [Acidimicrobiales bacterium]|nr:M20 family metallopeptidase [Acidimicrobiales bacterium]